MTACTASALLVALLLADASGAAFHPGIPPGALVRDAASTLVAERFAPPSDLLTALVTLGVDDHLLIEGFPVAPGARQPIVVERIDTYAPGARIFVVDGGGAPREIPRSSRLGFLASSPVNPSLRVAFTLDPSNGTLRGVVTGDLGTFVLQAPATDEPQHRLLDEGATPWAGKLTTTCGNDALPVPPEVLRLASQPPASAAHFLTFPEGNPTYGATIAVDTDNEWNHEKFANNTTNATNWLVDLFVEMNVMYERDVALRLLQGDTFLRRDLDVPPTYNDDPWTVSGSGASTTHLNEFGTYWAANMGGVSRVMAMLLSGKSSSANSSSGIAWVDGYCETQNTGGGYSVTQTFTANISVLNDVRVIAHELGHNFGSPHTHCYAPPVDTCWAAEAGCYAGAISCPGGPGTMMSYCHRSVASGGANCGSNQIAFHPTVIGLINGFINAHQPACIVPLAVPIFDDGFETGNTNAWSDTVP